ncbi:hypothetical protein Mapa_014254 [Marchantia paleacea]|nr:hypothetical protein Mapa_014254 [Marchantia paleacea]
MKDSHQLSCLWLCVAHVTTYVQRTLRWCCSLLSFIQRKHTPHGNRTVLSGVEVIERLVPR